ncbi:unnamed protein product [Sphagnum balticum]
MNVDSHNLYGVGKASDYQAQPQKYTGRTETVVDKLEVPELILGGQRVVKADGGLKFTLIWAQKNKLLALGCNRYGQCGQNKSKIPEIKLPTVIPFLSEIDD